MFKQAKKKKATTQKVIALFASGFVILFACVNAGIFVQAFEQTNSIAPTSDLKITTNIEDGQIALSGKRVEEKVKLDVA
jgi:hypothetical protein